MRKMKVFDCQDMPEDIRAIFFGLYEHIKCNDVYVNHELENDTDPPVEYQKLDAWLIANGAKGAKNEHSHGEEVLIKHWW